MSLSVRNLTKTYGQQRAVDGISFEAKKGQVLGFLGPNGAGKTTTMKMVTGFSTPTEGQVEVCGIDVRTSPLEAKRKIGYLPEHNPLYKDMYVKEYLTFVARTYQLTQKTAKIADIIERTGLTPEQHKKIGMLSKGYRQRVGLAQALIHEPEVLVLDEPTSGLDPNQLVGIRQLIRELGKEKTVVLSTHIMQEVQAVCDQVLIINKGKIVANDPIEKLSRRLSGNRLFGVAFLEKTDAKALAEIKGVVDVQAQAGNRFLLRTEGEIDLRPDLFHFAVENKLTLVELVEEKQGIEEVFQLLTGN
jgi:ABC-2 type transport system ATP-binding protein